MLLDQLAQEITSMNANLTQAQSLLAEANSTIDRLNGEKNILMATNERLTKYPQITSEQIKTQRIIGVALLFNYMRVPYKFGGNWDTDKAFDCSGFTQVCFRIGAGIALPRDSRQQSEVGTDVAFEDMKPGDLIFYDFNHDGTISHVSMYIGSDKMIHTNTPLTGINIQASTWSKSGIVKIKRVDGLA